MTKWKEYATWTVWVALCLTIWVAGFWVPMIHRALAGCMLFLILMFPLWIIESY